jgi:CBS domain-containing membrane protein
MELKTEQFISTNLICIDSLSNLASAYQKMKTFNIRHLLVVDAQKKMIGIISDRDIQRGSVADASGFKSFRDTAESFDPKARVWDYMSSPVETIPYDLDLITISKRMLDEKISAFAISKDMVIIGIITSMDLLAVLNILLARQNLQNEESLLANLQKWFYKMPVGEIASSLAQCGI